MVVQSCPECGLKVTDEQESCPKCQTVIPKEVVTELVDEKAFVVEKKPVTRRRRNAAKKAEAQAEEVQAEEVQSEEAAPPILEAEAVVAQAVEIPEEVVIPDFIDKKPVPKKAEDAEDLKAVEEKKETKAAKPKKTKAEPKVAAAIVAPVVEEKAPPQEAEEKLATRRRARKKKAMVSCPQCSADVPEGQNFCGVCGGAVGAMETHETIIPLTKEEDRGTNKGLAAIAYVLIFIPFLTGDFKKSIYVKFHTNQALGFLVSSIAFILVLSLIQNIMHELFFPNTIAILVDGTHTIANYGVHGGRLYWRYLSLIFSILHLLPFAFMFIGIRNALAETRKPLPIIGNWFKFFK